MDSTIFKHKNNYQQSNQHCKQKSNSIYNCSSRMSSISRSASQNNNNRTSIFILNTANHHTFPDNPQLYCSDLNDNNVASSSASSSVWSSASSNMCSPAAHAIQKLFNCSSSSLKFSHRHDNGIESKPFKSKSEILKKKSKFWKYLEAEANYASKSTQRGIEDANGNVKTEKVMPNSHKHKAKYWSKASESDNQNQTDLSELLQYSCSLCDNCRCVDCQINYFDCENSDDGNSEYSFHLSASAEDGEVVESDEENVSERSMELKSYENCCYTIDNKQNSIQTLEIEQGLPTTNAEVNCTKVQCCQPYLTESIQRVDGDALKSPRQFLTVKGYH